MSIGLSKWDKEKILKEFQRSELDTGSSEVQIALLTHRIKSLTEHFKIHKKDNHGRLGLIKLVSQRKKLMNYLRTTDLDKYNTIKEKLNIRK